MKDLKDLKDMSDEERQEAVLDLGKKVDETVGEKFRSAKGWFLKVFGGVLLLVGVIVLLAGGTNAGLGISGGGLTILSFGLRSASVKVRGILCCLGIVLLGVAFLNYGMGQISKAKQSVNWPSVTGTVVSSKTEQHTSTETSGSTKREVTYDVAIITYEYNVGGKNYSSNKVAFGGQKRGSAYMLVKQYPREKSVPVYYDPDNPEDAVLEPGMKEGSYFLPIFGVIIILFGFLFAWKSLKQNKQT